MLKMISYFRGFLLCFLRGFWISDFLWCWILLLRCVLDVYKAEILHGKIGCSLLHGNMDSSPCISDLITGSITGRSLNQIILSCIIQANFLCALITVWCQSWLCLAQSMVFTCLYRPLDS